MSEPPPAPPAPPEGRNSRAPALEGPFAPKVPEHRARLCPRSAFHTRRRGEPPCGEPAAHPLPPATPAETSALGPTCLELRWGESAVWRQNSFKRCRKSDFSRNP